MISGISMQNVKFIPFAYQKLTKNRNYIIFLNTVMFVC